MFYECFHTLSVHRVISIFMSMHMQDPARACPDTGMKLKIQRAVFASYRAVDSKATGENWRLEVGYGRQI